MEVSGQLHASGRLITVTTGWIPEPTPVSRISLKLAAALHTQIPLNIATTRTGQSGFDSWYGHRFVIMDDGDSFLGGKATAAFTFTVW
jgi:hypothetical protein